VICRLLPLLLVYGRMLLGVVVSANSRFWSVENAVIINSGQDRGPYLSAVISSALVWNMHTT
jgi:hypothetical protein